MKKINNKGFTLIEVLAVIILIAIIGGIAIPNIMSTINTGKSSSEKTMIANIKTASEQLYEEVENQGLLGKTDNTEKLHDYDKNGIEKGEITISNNSITIHLQTLVTNGFLSGTGENNETKKLLNPRTRENIGDCKIEIKKTVNTTNYKTTYEVKKADSNSICPADYN